jgi:signal transduction histidine kinase
MEEHLSQTQKMEAMGRLGAGVAHGLNNYLTVIDSYIDLLLLDLGPAAPVHHELGEIAKAVELSKTLTRQLLAFGWQQTGAAVHPQMIDINAAISRAEGILRRLAGNEVDLIIQCDPQLGLVLADPGQIEQVLLNLVGNARDAIFGAGTITIQTANLDSQHVDGRPSTTEPSVMIAISNTGAGIDPETLPTSLSHSTPQRSMTAAPGWGCPLSTASCSRAADTLRSRAQSDKARSSGSTCPEPQANEGTAMRQTHLAESKVIVECSIITAL